MNRGPDVVEDFLDDGPVLFQFLYHGHLSLALLHDPVKLLGPVLQLLDVVRVRHALGRRQIELHLMFVHALPEFVDRI